MLYKKITRLILVSALISFAITAVNYLMGSYSVRSLEAAAINFVVNFVFAFFLTFVNERFFKQLTKWLPWNEKPAQRLVFGVLGSVILTMSIIFILISLTQIWVFNSTWEQFIASQSIDWYITGILITLFFAAAFHAFYFYKELQRIRIKEQKVIAGTATAQLDALKNQLDPHFLFNSLNVLVSLIEENPDAAVNFTTSLSKVYRYVLEQRGKELVSLEEELKFARTYVRLLKMRFEESIEISIPEHVSHPDLQIVPLSLQLLIENAVKHNVTSSSQPLRLSIYEKGNQLIVENNLQEKSVIANSTGIGLNNIASRYALLTTHKMTIDKSRTSFKVNLPLLDKSNMVQSKIKTMEATAEDIKLVNAREKVKNIKEFYEEVVKTIVILLFLAVLNFLTTDFPWVLFPAIGMGLGLFFKYMNSFDKSLFMGNDWKQRKINELMNDQNF